jgi:hypothetical protein
VWESGHFRVTHAPVDRARPGSLIVATRRRVLDFAGAAEFGPLLPRLYPAVLAATGAERVHAVAAMGLVPHFHVWVVPRAAEAELRGIPHLAAPGACAPEEAEAAVGRIRGHLQ